jgi:hypothetical protein
VPESTDSGVTPSPISLCMRSRASMLRLHLHLQHFFVVHLRNDELD